MKSRHAVRPPVKTLGPTEGAIIVLSASANMAMLSQAGGRVGCPQKEAASSLMGGIVSPTPALPILAMAKTKKEEMSTEGETRWHNLRQPAEV